jgi:hypothetical protein
MYLYYVLNKLCNYYAETDLSDLSNTSNLNDEPMNKICQINHIPEINYPISFEIIKKLKKKYNYSDYIITTTLWSLFLYEMNYADTFFHIISCRKKHELDKQGNYFCIEDIKIADDFEVTCKNMKSIIENNKINYISKHECVYSCVRQFFKMKKKYIFFNSWLTYKHLSFNKNDFLGGVYILPFVHNAINKTHYVLINDNSYFLSHTVKNIHNSDFMSFLSKYS